MIDTIDKIKTDSPFDEDRYTLEYMSNYGIDNVRGGSFVTPQLDKSTKDHIEKMIMSALDKCFKCKQSGHFAKNCELFALREEVKRLRNELEQLRELLVKNNTQSIKTHTTDLYFNKGKSWDDKNSKELMNLVKLHELEYIEKQIGRTEGSIKYQVISLIKEDMLKLSDIKSLKLKKDVLDDIS